MKSGFVNSRFAVYAVSKKDWKAWVKSKPSFELEHMGVKHSFYFIPNVGVFDWFACALDSRYNCDQEALFVLLDVAKRQDLKDKIIAGHFNHLGHV